MERHREILLESYLVHRADANGDGKLDAEERKVVLQEVLHGLRERHARTSLQQQRLAMESADLPLPKVSKLEWSSFDGYPFALSSPANPVKEFKLRAPAPPTFGFNNRPHERNPSFDFVEMCLTSDFTSDTLSHIDIDAQMLFRLFAKDYPYCGDTLLSILIPVTQSGLQQLLPPPTHKNYVEIIRQLHKYAYTVSTTTSEFIMAKSVDSLIKGFNKVLKIISTGKIAQFCVNDDVENGDSKFVNNMDTTFKGIMQGFYGGLTADGGKSPVEKLESVEEINSAGLKFWGNSARKGGPGYEEEALVKG